ncbi:spore gernimation protein GerA [Bacillus sp. FJAT-27231]|uniref:spore germination protein n=1 Tax=Bacillus sp. FJAT-27231 TaxID=1679168 RepID=UPI00067119F2|nr:spore germination protein [Bacillus sp. FJAT-27231]KMY55326.1 spore gernimation protein GerA [Bacillus sp. FJAT-27231]
MQRSTKATETIRWITKQLKPNTDFVEKHMKIERKEAALLFIKTVVDGDQLQKLVIKPFFEMDSETHYEAYLQSLPSQQEITTKEKLIIELTKGSVIIVIRGQLIMLDVKKVNTNNVLEAAIETTTQGPQYAFSEDIQTNINLVRQRYHEPTLTVEMFEVGAKSHQALVLMYDRETVSKEVLDKVRKSLKELKEPIIQSTVELKRVMGKKKYTLFPKMMVTERTDRVVYNLSGGKVVILLDGDPFAIIAPCVFFDFLSAMDDNYYPYFVVKFLKGIRYLGMFLSLVLPGLYVAVSSYNPEIFRVQLALSVAGSRVGIPYPSFIEVLFMLLIMELLIEASVRLPKVISGTATTVGGLILGTAATEAALVSNIMIIIVSAVAISNFAIPINEMNTAIRVMKFVLLLIATISGIAGLTLGLIGLVMYLTHLNSFGEPYLKVFIQKKANENEGI